MLSRIMLASALLASALFAPASALSSAGEMMNGDFESAKIGAGNQLVPSSWHQGGSGSEAKPTVVLSDMTAHSGKYSAMFLPQTVTDIKDEMYTASLTQDVWLLQKGQQLSLSWWAKFTTIPEGVLAPPRGGYKFAVSYGLPGVEDQVLEAKVVQAKPGASDNSFYHYNAVWNAPMNNEHVNASITLKFTAYQSVLYMHLDDIEFSAQDVHA